MFPKLVSKQKSGICIELPSWFFLKLLHKLAIRPIAFNKFVFPKYFILGYPSISILGKDESFPVVLMWRMGNYGLWGHKQGPK